MEIEIKIDNSRKEPKIIIVTDKITDEVNVLLKKLAEESPPILTGFRDNHLEVLEQSEILRIYAEGGKVLADTKDGEYTLRQRLYELEAQLEPQHFIRISNSEIINLKKTKKFDLSYTGTIRVILADDSVSYVSRRYVSKIKKVLGV